MMDKSNEKIYIVTKQHTSNYPIPIKVCKGETINVGKTYEGHEDWNNWVYCYNKERQLEGWVPQQIIHIHDNQGLILEDYIAKELDVNIGERILKIKELNGWLWVKRIINSEEGWIPKDSVE